MLVTGIPNNIIGRNIILNVMYVDSTHIIIVVFCFTPESDQCQNSPAASQEIWHHTVWRTWLFISYSDEKWLYYKFSLHHSCNRFLKGWENTLFELRSERVNYCYCLFFLLYSFVSSLCLLPTHPELLISGGGVGARPFISLKPSLM